jgi:hypothetical protein
MHTYTVTSKQHVVALFLASCPPLLRVLALFGVACCTRRHHAALLLRKSCNWQYISFTTVHQNCNHGCSTCSCTCCDLVADAIHQKRLLLLLLLPHVTTHSACILCLSDAFSKVQWTAQPPTAAATSRTKGESSTTPPQVYMLMSTTAECI